MSQLQQKIGPAIIQALIVCIVRFFTIPLSICEKREKGSGTITVIKKA